MSARYFVVATALALMTACAEMETKQDAFPNMYGEGNPKTIVVVPAINESTAAEAGDLLNVTVAQPLVNHGYYVLPIPIVSSIFSREGIISGAQLKGRPTRMFKESFGADAVLFLTISNWDTNYIVIGGNVTVGIEYVMLSTETGELLWSYDQTVVVDTSGSSGNIIADMIITAVSTAVTDYVPVARQVNQQAVAALPLGPYHPRHGADGADRTVRKASREEALAE